MPIFAGKQLGGPLAQIPSVLAGAGQVGPDGFVLAGANYARQHGKRVVSAQIVSGLVIFVFNFSSHKVSKCCGYEHSP